jgi:hypothetical protein
MYDFVDFVMFRECPSISQLGEEHQHWHYVYPVDACLLGVLGKRSCAQGKGSMAIFPTIDNASQAVEKLDSTGI